MSLAPEPIDVLHLGRERVICAWRVGDVLVDPGPASCLPNLLRALDGWQPRALALTHIHLDHAGAAGTLARRWPSLEVWVHERGVRHLIDPQRLLDSAARLYGDRMATLWGEVLPVAPAQLRSLEGGEVLRGLEVAATPGHASHHVAYRHGRSGVVFAGDVAGVRIPPADLVLAPTPPPDIDLERWDASLRVLEAWGATGLALTHFGLHEDPGAHLDSLRERMGDWAARARRLELEPFVAQVRAEIGGAVDEATAAAYEQAAPPEQLWAGLRRYWERRPQLRGA